MGTGWRRAFCTTIPRDKETFKPETKQQRSTSSSPKLRSCTKLGFLSGSVSNPSTPKILQSSSPSLRCRISVDELRQSKSTTTTPRTRTSKNLITPSNPSSPRSPLKLSLFKNSFKFRSSCGLCLNSVKTGQGTAIYTAECGHAFHFPCIADHVRKQGKLVCPVCNTTWKDVPLLAVHKNLGDGSRNDNINQPDSDNIVIEEKRVVESSSSSFSPRLVQKPDSRSYDDDEQLLSSPSAGARFVTIPEADEDVDNEEFQGFFVDPVPSRPVKSDEIPLNVKDLNNVKVRFLPESAVVSIGRGYETYAVALRVKAPPPTGSAKLDSGRGLPVDLVAVLDVSGRMAGAKLNMLKRAVQLLINSLSSADRLSIVAFSTVSKRLLPLRRMTAHGQRAARRVIDRLVCSQGRNASDGLRKATKVLEDRRERNPVASIILLSDGQLERIHSNNNQRQELTHVSSTGFARIEIPVHAFGLGELTGYYSHEPAEPEDAFFRFTRRIFTMVVQDLRIQLSVGSGSDPCEISAVYLCNGRSTTALSSGSIRLGDFYSEEERELLVELRVPSPVIRSHHVLSVRCLYKDPSTQEVVYGRDQSLLVPRPHTVRSSNPKIERLRNLFISTRAVAESRRLIEHNDFTSAHHLLVSARALIMQFGSETAEEYVALLEAELAEVHWRRQQQMELTTVVQRRGGSEREAVEMIDENGEPLTPSSAWKAAERLAKLAVMKKSLNRVSDLHGFENARF